MTFAHAPEKITRRGEFPLKNPATRVTILAYDLTEDSESRFGATSGD